MSTPWSETLFPYGAPVGVAPASAISNDLQINKNNPGIQFLGTEANAVFSEEREIAGDLWFVTNATYASTGTPGQWTQVNAAAASYALVLRAAGPIQRLTAPSAAPNPVVWTTISSTDALGNQSLTAGTLTGPSSIPLAVTATWNAPAQAMTAQRINVTDTASAANSLLLDLQVGGVSKFSVRKDGSITAGTISGYVDTSATPQTKVGAFTTNGNLSAGGNVATTGGAFQGGTTFYSAGTQVGDATLSRTTTTGALFVGGTAEVLRLDFGVSNAHATTLSGIGGSATSDLYLGGLHAASAALTTPLPVGSGGTGSATQNFVDLSTTQTVAGAKTFSSALTSSSNVVTTGGAFQGGTAPYNAGLLAVGDATLSRSASTGALFLGGLTSAVQIDYGVTHANATTLTGAGGSATADLYAGVLHASGASLTSIPWAALPYTPVQSVTAGSTKATIGGTATNPTVDVNPANFANGTVPNAALVTTPLDVSSTAQTKSGQLTLAAPSTNSGLVASANGVAFVDPNPGVANGVKASGGAAFDTLKVTGAATTGALTSAGHNVGGALTGATTGVFSGSLTSAGHNVGGALTGATSGTFTGTVTVNGSANLQVSALGATSSPTGAAAGDGIFQRSASTGVLSLGGATSSASIDYGINTAGVLTVNKPLAAGGTTAYLPPVYTAAGAALASTTHIVQGSSSTTFGGASLNSNVITVSLTGAAAFAATPTVVATPYDGVGTYVLTGVVLTAISTTSFSLKVTASTTPSAGYAVTVYWTAVGA